MPVTFSSFPIRTAQRARTYAVLRTLVNMSDGLPAAGQLPGQSERPGEIVINFPCMPETVELARRANYKNVLHSPVHPDGLHFYDYTEPLSIPLSFNLHSYDEDYCGTHGPVMLLSIAAKLHALMLPIIPDIGDGTAPLKSGMAAPPVLETVPNGASDDVQKEVAARNSQKQSDFDQNTIVRNGKLEFIPSYARSSYPPACSLNLMMAQLGGSAGDTNTSNDGLQSLGISCTGFVSDVRVVFKGPWLQGSFRENGLRNLPSEAEYSFTFVHQPGYTNNFLGGGSPFVSTTADQIFRRLYNTADLVGQKTVVGINGDGLPPLNG